VTVRRYARGVRRMLAIGLLAIVGPALAAVPALAANTSFSIPIPAISLSGGATATGFISLSGSVVSGFSINFVLPADYKSGSTVKIVMLMSSNVPPCVADFKATQMARRRVGLVQTSGLSGLKPRGGPNISFAGPELTKKVFDLKPGSGFPGQRRNDGIGISFSRNPGAAADTCASAVSVMTIYVLYETKS